MGQTSIIVCPTKLIFHIPCPGCGITRATLLVLNGHIREAFLLNPNVILSILFLFVYPIILLYDIWSKQKTLISAYQLIDSMLKKPLILGIFAILEIGIWIHNILYHV